MDSCAVDGVIPREGRLFPKMDTQGYDLEVFRGAHLLLPNIKSLLSELSLIPIYDGMPTYLQALSTYQAAGFSVSGFYPVTRNEKLALNEVDCVMVRTDPF